MHGESLKLLVAHLLNELQGPLEPNSLPMHASRPAAVPAAALQSMREIPHPAYNTTRSEHMTSSATPTKRCRQFSPRHLLQRLWIPERVIEHRLHPLQPLPVVLIHMHRCSPIPPHQHSPLRRRQGKQHAAWHELPHWQHPHTQRGGAVDAARRKRGPVQQGGLGKHCRLQAFDHVDGQVDGGMSGAQVQQAGREAGDAERVVGCGVGWGWQRLVNACREGVG